MIIKNENTERTNLSFFDLLGNDEVALSKAFSYVLASDQDCYFKFLKFLGVRKKRNNSSYYTVAINTEKIRNEGRTDIELVSENDYHIIIECKIKKGKVLQQRTQYLTAFNEGANTKLLVFLTQERDTNKQIQDNITIKNTSWLEIIELYNTRQFTGKKIVADFLDFATKNYKMNQLKEILIQDLGDRSEIERFENYRVYRRNETFGTPIYFSPYFTRNSGKQEGINTLSKILGILTLKPKDIDHFKSDLENFSKDREKVAKWIAGVNHGNDKSNNVYTYYFLDNPYQFTLPLRKDGGIEKGRGKNWIAGKIPQNRCVSFIDFIKHIPELKE